MTPSRERLLAESAALSFRPEILEKVARLLSLLDAIRTHPHLRTRVALKGGTALNLFVFAAPRLSVDIDLNYIGGADRETMLAERPEIERAIEVANALQVAVRRTRIAPEMVDRCIARHLQLPWAFEMQTSELRLAAIGRLASVHHLSASDAAYLELAMHRTCGLVSLDKPLRAAARSERLEVLPARVAS